MKNRDRQQWESEYLEFIQAAPAQPEVKLSQQIAGHVSHDLNPSSQHVFLKMLLTYVLTGAFTLLVCPQYGLGQDLGLMSIFMTLGHKGCLLACGAFFLGSGTLALFAVLRPEELRVAYRFQIWQIPAAALLLHTLLNQFGSSLPLHASALWLTGAVIGSMTILQARRLLKSWSTGP